MSLTCAMPLRGVLPLQAWGPSPGSPHHTLAALASGGPRASSPAPHCEARGGAGPAPGRPRPRSPRALFTTALCAPPPPAARGHVTPAGPACGRLRHHETVPVPLSLRGFLRAPFLSLRNRRPPRGPATRRRLPKHGQAPLGGGPQRGRARASRAAHYFVRGGGIRSEAEPWMGGGGRPGQDGGALWASGAEAVNSRGAEEAGEHCWGRPGWG